MPDNKPGPYGQKMDELGRSVGGWSGSTLVCGIEFVSDDQFRLLGSQATWNEKVQKWDFSNFSPSEVTVTRDQYLTAHEPPQGFRS